MKPEAVLSAMGVSMINVYEGVQFKNGWEHHAWKVKIRRGRKSFSNPYMMGLALDNEPEAVEVMENMFLDIECASMSLKEFADEFGYKIDTPERKKETKAVHSACKKELKKLEHLFTKEELEEIHEAIFMPNIHD